jgi:hypothetical protein
LPICNVALGQSRQPTSCLPAKPNFKEENSKRVQIQGKIQGQGMKFSAQVGINEPAQHKKCHDIKHKYSKYIVM